MKKTLSVMLASAAIFGCFAFASCADRSENVKVFKELELTAEDYAFAVKKGNTEFKTSINAILDEMGDDGSLETLINSYFDGTATFTYENKSSSPQTGDLVVATNAYFPPFEYFEGNKFKGVDIEIASKIATKLGKTLFVKDMDFEAIIPSVASGESDIGMAGLTVNDERLKTVDFSLGYYSSYQVITVRESTTLFDECKNAEDVENILKAQNSKYKIGTQNGTTGYMYSAGDSGFGYDGFKNLTTKGYTTGALAMKDLSNGKIDAVILDKQPSLMIAATLNK
ncbi:MAG: transporter substrate-binding domain-containing protein [Christensenellaceae bacterium]